MSGHIEEQVSLALLMFRQYTNLVLLPPPEKLALQRMIRPTIAAGGTVTLVSGKNGLKLSFNTKPRAEKVKHDPANSSAKPAAKKRTPRVRTVQNKPGGTDAGGVGA